MLKNPLQTIPMHVEIFIATQLVFTYILIIISECHRNVIGCIQTHRDML
jgi:hypothetical protein